MCELRRLRRSSSPNGAPRAGQLQKSARPAPIRARSETRWQKRDRAAVAGPPAVVGVGGDQQHYERGVGLGQRAADVDAVASGGCCRARPRRARRPNRCWSAFIPRSVPACATPNPRCPSSLASRPAALTVSPPPADGALEPPRRRRRKSLALAGGPPAVAARRVRAHPAAPNRDAVLRVLEERTGVSVAELRVHLRRRSDRPLHPVSGRSNSAARWQGAAAIFEGDEFAQTLAASSQPWTTLSGSPAWSAVARASCWAPVGGPRPA